MHDKPLTHDPLFLSRFETIQTSLRFWVLAGGIFFLFLILSMRLCWITLIPSSPSCFQKNDIPFRSEIVDRNGVVLASSIATFSVYAHPKRIAHKNEVACQLHKIFPALPEKKLLQMLDPEKPFVWIARHISPETKMQVHALGIEGVELLKEQKRIYPHDNLFCQVLGLTTIDHQGLSGIEKTFDNTLTQNPQPLCLSLDTRLQHCVHKHLSETVDQFSAIGGNALLVDMHTGEILAMVSLPDFSMTHPSQSMTEGFFNRNTNGVYEFGSLLKIFNVAMVLDSKIADLNSVYDASAPLQLGRFKITDFKGQNRPLTVSEAFIYSSNIANAKMALAAGITRQTAFFKKMGFFSPVPLELPGIARPLLPKKWGKASLITAAYGYGFSLTPLHLMQGLQILLMGRPVPLTILRCTEPAIHKKRVVSVHTSLQIASLLGLAVTAGQAKKAASHSCSVGAKTGTANQLTGGHYQQKKNLTSCISVFPIEAPRYALLVCVDQPKANAKTLYFATAGWIAAPVTASIVNDIAPLLQLIHLDSPSLEQTVHTILKTQVSEL